MNDDDEGTTWQPVTRAYLMAHRQRELDRLRPWLKAACDEAGADEVLFERAWIKLLETVDQHYEASLALLDDEPHGHLH